VNIGQHRPGPSNADPFYVSPMAAPPMESSPTAAINALANLRAQADAASALLRPVQRYRRDAHQTVNQTQINNQSSVTDLHNAANLIPHPVRRIRLPHIQENGNEQNEHLQFDLLQQNAAQFQLHNQHLQAAANAIPPHPVIPPPPELALPAAR
jgi:hypothetical protein